MSFRCIIFSYQIDHLIGDPDSLFRETIKTINQDLAVGAGDGRVRRHGDEESRPSNNDGGAGREEEETVREHTCASSFAFRTGTTVRETTTSRAR